MNSLFKKRLSLLEDIGDVLISKNGNYYVIIDSSVITCFKTYNSYTITKSQIHKIGIADTNYNVKQDSIVMLTKDNKLKFKPFGRNSKFIPLSFKILSKMPNLDIKICKLYLYNKKCEWILNHFDNISFLFSIINLVKSFKSLKELLKYLNYTSKLKDIKNLENLITGYHFTNKTNLINCSTSILQDTVNMINNTESFHYYSSNKSIQAIHDELIEIVNKKEIEKYSSDIIVPEYKYKVDSKLLSNNIIFRSLDSARELALQGRIQNHCISSRINRLSTDLFYEIKYNDSIYSLQCNESSVIEIKGKYNSYPPEELLQQIKTIF